MSKDKKTAKLKDMPELKLVKFDDPGGYEAPPEPDISTFEEQVRFISSQFYRISCKDKEQIDHMNTVVSSFRDNDKKSAYMLRNAYNYRKADNTIAVWAFALLSMYDAYTKNFAKLAVDVFEEVCEAQPAYSHKEAFMRTRYKFIDFIEYELTTNGVYKYVIQYEHIFQQIAMIEQTLAAREKELEVEDSLTDENKKSGITGFVIRHIPTGDFVRKGGGFLFTTNIQFAEVFAGVFSARNRIWRYDPEVINRQMEGIFEILAVYKYKDGISVFKNKETPFGNGGKPPAGKEQDTKKSDKPKKTKKT
jgi:hypothetical protein